MSLGSPCEGDTDCESNVCDNGTCVEANCEDGRANGSESGVDCGGDCPPCGAGDPCNESSDCASRNCVDGVCLGPTCMDGIRNGEESGVDCGVVCGVGCPDGTPCDLGTDCLSGVCVMGACAPPECGDGTVNGEETCDDGNDIDTDAVRPIVSYLPVEMDLCGLAKNNATMVTEKIAMLAQILVRSPAAVTASSDQMKNVMTAIKVMRMSVRQPAPLFVVTAF